MHTSSGVDNIDEYLETIVKKGDRLFYRYGDEERPVTATTITVPYKSGSGMAREDVHGLLARTTARSSARPTANGSACG